MLRVCIVLTNAVIQIITFNMQLNRICPDITCIVHLHLSINYLGMTDWQISTKEGTLPSTPTLKHKHQQPCNQAVSRSQRRVDSVLLRTTQRARHSTSAVYNHQVCMGGQPGHN